MYLHSASPKHWVEDQSTVSDGEASAIHQLRSIHTDRSIVPNSNRLLLGIERAMKLEVFIDQCWQNIGRRHEDKNLKDHEYEDGNYQLSTVNCPRCHDLIVASFYPFLCFRPIFGVDADKLRIGRKALHARYIHTVSFRGPKKAQLSFFLQPQILLLLIQQTHSINQPTSIPSTISLSLSFFFWYPVFLLRNHVRRTSHCRCFPAPGFLGLC